MSVRSTKKSLKKLAGNTPQHLVRVAAPLSTATDNELSKKQLIVLLHLFQGLLNFTYSPDARYLTVKAAVKKVKHLMSEEEATAIAEQLMSIRESSFMDSLF